MRSTNQQPCASVRKEERKQRGVLPITPPLSDVAEVFDRFPEPLRVRFLAMRALIFEVAQETNGVGPLTETLKWGEPAYLTQSSKSGTTIRLGTVRSAPEDSAVLFNCRTTLVDMFRNRFADVFRFEGNRAVIVPIDEPLPEAQLAMCFRRALTYHRCKNEDCAEW